MRYVQLRVKLRSTSHAQQEEDIYGKVGYPTLVHALPLPIWVHGVHPESLLRVGLPHAPCREIISTQQEILLYCTV